MQGPGERRERRGGAVQSGKEDGDCVDGLVGSNLAEVRPRGGARCPSTPRALACTSNGTGGTFCGGGAMEATWRAVGTAPRPGVHLGL